MVFGEPGSSATSTTWLNVLLCSVIAMPAVLASDPQSVSISPQIAGSLMYSTLNVSLVPAGMPLPHSPAPVPGLAQVLTPPGTVCVLCGGWAGLSGDPGAAGPGP